jgi:hydroxymethylpyrimidine/phosphomethylpyrimidine kinase
MTYEPRAGAAALTIAGSDSGGGAGIQADLRTFFAHGLLGATAVTAVTAQNTLGVTAWEAVSAALVRAQIAAVLADLPVVAMKTGMLGTAAVIAAVCEALAQVDARGGRLLPLVVDPVMVATSGHRLLDPDAEEALKAQLLPRALVVTPNLAEAAALSGLPVAAPAAEHAEAIRVWASSAWIIVKGGHGVGLDCVDFVAPPASPAFTLSGRRVATRATHGTGCTLSAAITAGLAQGAEPEAAIRHARWYVQRAIEFASELGAGHGPLNHGFAREPLRVGAELGRDASGAP